MQRRGFRRGDERPGGSGRGKSRRFDVDDGGTEAAQHLERSVHAGRDAGVGAVVEVARRPPDAQALDGSLQRGDVIGDRARFAGRIVGIGAGEHRQQLRGVLHAARQRADAIQRVRQRHRPGTRDAAVGRHHADGAAEARRQADRAASVRAERGEVRARRHGGPGAGGRAAGDVVGVPGIAAMAEMPVVAGGVEGELRHVEGRELDCAGGVEPGERVRGARRRALAQDLRAAGRDFARAVVHVLVRHRHAVQRAAPAAGRRVAVGGLRGRQGALGVDADETVQARLGLRRRARAPPPSPARSAAAPPRIARQARSRRARAVRPRSSCHAACLRSSSKKAAGSSSKASASRRGLRALAAARRARRRPRRAGRHSARRRPIPAGR